MKIKKLKNKYKIELENEVIYTYEEIIIKYGLLYKKNLTDELINKIKEENDYYSFYNKVLNKLSRKLYSEYEIEKYLKLNKCEYTNKIINKLKEINLLNDNMYASAYINDKINLSYDGPSKIKRDLIKNKIDSNIIDNYLDNINNNIFISKIDKIINKKIINNTKDTKYILKTKILNYLINLGYDKSLINERLEIAQFKEIDLSKQLDKEYIKLSKKYSSNELTYKFKQKMYSKGFSLSEIENYLNNK